MYTYTYTYMYMYMYMYLYVYVYVYVYIYMYTVLACTTACRVPRMNAMRAGVLEKPHQFKQTHMVERNHVLGVIDSTLNLHMVLCLGVPEQ